VAHPATLTPRLGTFLTVDRATGLTSVDPLAQKFGLTVVPGVRLDTSAHAPG
jgi:hypothetical protein